MGKYWKEPKKQSWFSFVVDGRVISVEQDSVKTQNEIKRLSGLAGIKIRPPTNEEYRKFNCKVPLTVAILNKMASEHAEAKREGVPGS